MMKLRKNMSDGGVRCKGWPIGSVRSFAVAAMLPMIAGCLLLGPGAGSRAESRQHQKANTK